MCGTEQNNVQAVEVFDNVQFELLIRDCDDIFLQPHLPYKNPPYPIHPITSNSEALVN